MTDIRMADVYCPRCWGFTSTQLVMHLSHSDKSEWECSRCGYFEWPFDTDDQGRFTWIWDDKHPSPNPGCPWCQTRNIQWSLDDHWSCLRYDCRKIWLGYWYRKTGEDWKTDRWKIRVPVSEVPWISGTFADLECARRLVDGPANCCGPDERCCRFPKECRAFDPGYTTGTGPTHLPTIWNDGYGWRSNAPDITKIPDHLVEQTLTAWNAALRIEPSPLEVNDPDARDCGQGCEYICRCY